MTTMKRIEVDDWVPSTAAPNLMAVRSALDAGGIEFIGILDGAPGIHIHFNTASARTPDQAF